jgi:hypothetical protein
MCSVCKILTKCGESKIAYLKKKAFISVLKVRRIFWRINPLTPELNPFTQRCLARFLLGLLLLEPCISLIYA